MKVKLQSKTTLAVETNVTCPVLFLSQISSLALHKVIVSSHALILHRSTMKEIVSLPYLSSCSRTLVQSFQNLSIPAYRFGSVHHQFRLILGLHRTPLKPKNFIRFYCGYCKNYNALSDVTHINMK